MWTCQDRDNFRPTRSLSIDSSTHFTVSPQNDYLFINCDSEKVIVEPKPVFCERFPDRCDSSCDSSSYLCRHLPECGSALGSRVSCCSYYPKATQSLRLMLQNCATYTSVYWRSTGAGNAPYDQFPEYGIRVDFEFPVTTKCLLCQDTTKGGGFVDLIRGLRMFCVFANKEMDGDSGFSGWSDWRWGWSLLVLEESESQSSGHLWSSKQ
ncbi:hypothetical protein Bca101_044097 [Brassica carinata]